MQIREAGRKVICIKTEYVPEKKRTYGRTVASQNINLSTVSDSVREALTDAEVAELQQWLDAREDREHADRITSSLSMLPRIMGHSVEAISGGVADLDETQAAAIWRQMGELQRTLKKAGYPRPRRETRQRASDDRQSPLL